MALIKIKAGIVYLRDEHKSSGEASLVKTVQKFISEGAGLIIATDDEDGDDASHQNAMDRLHEICESVDVPVIGTGDIRRMEDVKKLLYAGCGRVLLKDTAIHDDALVEEVTGKFGPAKLARLADPQTADDRDGTGLSVMAPLADMALRDSGTAYMTEIMVSEDILPKPLEAAIAWDELKKGADGLVPVVVQDYRTDEVLMVAYMNGEAYEKTIETGRMTYYSRSRQSLWIKGETSGHYQYVRSITADCDKDTILAKVRQIGAACHTGARSCFFNEIAARETLYKNPRKVLEDVYAVIADRKVNPKEGSYTNYLFDKGIDKILKKCGEEATEIVIAAKNPNDNEIIYEISDFLYHVMVLMVEKGVTWDDIGDELARR